ncbi:YihY/virulence factor BrkB family protein [Bremerella cremea]|nr:YihY/virulence factor BrkB family protein [Bremerella cremea]
MHENIPSDRKPEIGMLQPWQRFISRFFTRWIEHDHSTSAAAIAFYVIFSLAPIVVFSISIAGQILENDAGAREMASEFLDNAMGEGYGKAIVDQVKMSAFRKATIIPTAFLSFIAVWSASATFMQLRLALNRIYGFTVEGLRGGLISVVLGRVRATLFSIGTGLLLALATLLSTWSHAIWVRLPVSKFISQESQNFITFQVISWLAVMIVFYCMLRFLPMKRPPWREVLGGAIIGTILFQVGKYIINRVAEGNVVATAYATSGALVITVMWIFLSAHVLLFAAEMGHMLFSPVDSPFEKYRNKTED